MDKEYEHKKFQKNTLFVIKSGFTVLPKNSDRRIYQIMAVQQDIYNLKYTEVLNKESLSRKGYYKRFHILEAVLTGL